MSTRESQKLSEKPQMMSNPREVRKPILVTGAQKLAVHAEETADGATLQTRVDRETTDDE